MSGYSRIPGQIQESQILAASAVTLTTATNADVTSLVLPAGIWDVSGAVETLPGAGTVTQQQYVWISTTSVTPPTQPGTGSFAVNGGAAANQVLCQPVGPVRITGGQTVYLSTQVSFTVSTNKAYGYLRATPAP